MLSNPSPLSKVRSSVATGSSFVCRTTPRYTRWVMSCHTPWRLTRTRTALRRGGIYESALGDVKRISDTTAPPYCSDSCGGSGHVTSYGAPGCCGTPRRAWRYACHCSRVVPGGTGASGSMIQSVSVRRRFRSARREAHAWASRSASISACVRQRISATDDHLQVVGPEAPPCVQRRLIVLGRLVLAWLRPRWDGSQEHHVQLTVHSPSRKPRAGVEDALDGRRLAVGEA